MESVIPVDYTIHNIPNARIDEYFQKAYLGELQAIVK